MYDVFYVWIVFLDIEKENCSIVDFLLEMDCILCFMGFVIIWDRLVIVDCVSKYFIVLCWLSWQLIVNVVIDDLLDEDEKILFVRKELW